MTFATIEVEAADDRGAIWLARPDKLNPLGTDTLHELAEAARWFDDRPSVKVVVVGGRGRAFSAGADVKEIQDALGASLDGFALFLKKPVGLISCSSWVMGAFT